ncbi:hypothetical protein NL676_029163 [Syzygium grande]|nr:hypothetical protein NL676_029163 [Syzygium grande]
MPPAPRDGHSCTNNVGDNLFVFGGTDGMNSLADLHILDTSSHTWISPLTRGEAPVARQGHNAALGGKRLFIFGGYGKFPDDDDEVYYNDLFILNTDTLMWKELNTAGEMLPPRAGRLTVTFGKIMFVYGGYKKDQKLYDDLYMLDVESAIWSTMTSAGHGPSPRFSMAAACLDPGRSGVLAFVGGCNGSFEVLDDIYYLHTGLTRVYERRLEKLRLRKKLKLKCQEQNLTLGDDQALVQVGVSTSSYQPVPLLIYDQSGQALIYVYCHVLE